MAPKGVLPPEPLAPNLMVPALMFVTPVKVLLPDSVVAPVPACVTPTDVVVPAKMADTLALLVLLKV